MSLRDDVTMAHLRDPQPGDRFHEMYSFWVYVLGVTNGVVIYCEANPPCTLPNDAKLTVATQAQFLARFSYGAIPGSWISYADGGNDVSGWAEHLLAHKPSDVKTT